MEIEVFVPKDGVGLDIFDNGFFFLQEKEGKRRLEISVTPDDAMMINSVVNNAPLSRPVMHGVAKALMDRVGCVLEKAVVDDLKEDVYHAKIYLKHGDEEMRFDARPSDAVNLALRCSVKIFVEESVFTKKDELMKKDEEETQKQALADADPKKLPQA